MNMKTHLIALFGACVLPLCAKEPPLPKENVIETPAITDGLSLHALFQSNMVLQRGKPIKIWGWADAGESVKVTLAGQSQSTQADKSSRWEVQFTPMEATTKPLSITVKGAKKQLQLHNILIGDVWVLGGQSNMEFPMRKVENGELEIATAHYPEIRILTVPQAFTADAPKNFARLQEWDSFLKTHHRKGYWDECSPEIVAELSAIGYVFGRNLHMAAQVPIGLVDVSVGGTTVEAWTPDEALRNIKAETVTSMMAMWDQKIADWDPQKDLETRQERQRKVAEQHREKGTEVPGRFRKVPTEMLPGPAVDRNRPGNSFTGMIAPLRGIQVKGAIFHQGFNNGLDGMKTAGMYPDVFPIMINSWREAFGDPKMPFGILSLCTMGKKQSLENYSEMMGNIGPHIREWQYQTFLDFYNKGDANIGFASTYDLRRTWFHPQLKRPAGERIARWALATQYGFNEAMQWKPAHAKEWITQEGSLKVMFDGRVGAVRDGGPIEGFAIAGDDRKFHPADAKLGNDNSVILSSPMVPSPVAFRYAWARNPMGNLISAPDVPVATQRSDDWPFAEIQVDGKLKNVGRRQLSLYFKVYDQERKSRMAQEWISKQEE